MSETRIPSQKRSVEKRNTIIKKGFELICENGYYKTNTTDIAKYAGVSTGIIYQYFNDKREIFIEGIKEYSDNIMFPILNIINNKIKKEDIKSTLNKLLDSFIKQHTLSKKAHEEMIALSHLDEEIANILNEKELYTTTKIVEALSTNNMHLINSPEKIHIILGIVENYCHEVVYHHHKSLNYDIMKKEVIEIIYNILS